MCCIGILICTGFIWAQNTSGSGISAGTPQSSLEPDTTPLVLTGPQQESRTPAAEGSGSTVWLFIRMILVLLIVIACIYGVVYFLKRSTNPSQAPDPYIKKVASLSLSPGKSVYIVTIGSQAFFIGASDASITLIGEVKDRELIDAMNLNEGKTHSGKKPKDFSSMVSSFFPGVRGKSADGKDPSGLSVSAAETGDFLRRQRDRLRDDSFGVAGVRASSEDTDNVTGEKL